MRTSLPALACTALVALAGCGSGSDTGVTTTVTETQVLTPAQQQLSASQITRALPDEEDVPGNFASDPGGRDPAEEGDDTTDPKACLAVELDTPEMRDFRDEHRRAAHASRFSDETGGLGLGILTVNLWTFDTQYPREYLDEAGAAVGDCSTYSIISADGAKTGPGGRRRPPSPSSATRASASASATRGTTSPSTTSGS